MIPRRLRLILAGTTPDAIAHAQVFTLPKTRDRGQELRCEEHGVLLTDGANGVRPCPLCGGGAA